MQNGKRRGKKRGYGKGKTRKNQTVWDKQGRSLLDVAVIRAKECADSLWWLKHANRPIIVLRGDTIARAEPSEAK